MCGGAQARWRFTKAHAPRRVLHARGVADDFYSQSLAWGGTRMAVLMGDSVLAFDPANPQQHISRFVAPASNGEAVLGCLTAVEVLPQCSGGVAELVIADAAGRGAVLTTSEGQQRESMLVKQRLGSACDDSCPPPLGRVAALGASPEHPSCVVAGNGMGAVRLFDLRAGPEPVTVFGEGCSSGSEDGGAEVCALRFSPSGSMLAAGCNDGGLFVWSLSMPNSPVAALPRLHCGAVKALAWSPAQHGCIATGGGSLDGSIAMTSLHHGGSPAPTPLAFTTAQVTQLGYSPDGAHLVTTHGFNRRDLGIPDELPFHQQRCDDSEAAGRNEVAIPRHAVCVWRVDGKSPLRLVAALRGHSARPLHMAQQGGASGGGVVATLAGGGDETIHFWSLFEMVASRGGNDMALQSASRPTTPSLAEDALFEDDEEAATSNSGVLGSLLLPRSYVPEDYIMADAFR